VERNKSISQKKQPQNFSAPPKDLSINYLSNSSYLCISRPKRVPEKKSRPTRKYLNIKQLEVPHLHKKRRMNEKEKESTLVEL